ncbi:unnamed protein product [Acanthoscelides obtectus]|uniref:Uncharacterized protein n=1 Tax=Acanthoscelides obtectus TaxID=200917 RepID=A0A9P0Q8Q1_ACAOB|nr:unnamed protein product [Acanthoscelides obtectus]CAK1635310.1 hypothetical protein AOBTE_LOCUS9192 [Acanthoscelides obtectus]
MATAPARSELPVMSCCQEEACTHSVVAAAAMEATRLSDKEREIILGVLAKDERLRRDQQIRVLSPNIAQLEESATVKALKKKIQQLQEKIKVKKEEKTITKQDNTIPKSKTIGNSKARSLNFKTAGFGKSKSRKNNRFDDSSSEDDPTNIKDICQDDYLDDMDSKNSFLQKGLTRDDCFTVRCTRSPDPRWAQENPHTIRKGHLGYFVQGHFYDNFILKCKQWNDSNFFACN